jgi:hypothetical protein
VHIDDERPVTDDLVDYIHRAHTWSPEFTEARRQSVRLPHDYTPDLAGIKAAVLLIHGRYDRMVPFEVSIAILNHVSDSRLSCSTIAAIGRPSRNRPSGAHRSSPSFGAIERARRAHNPDRPRAEGGRFRGAIRRCQPATRKFDP